MAPLLEHHATSGHHLQSYSSSYWIDNLGFITEGKLAAIFIKTFSWGFPTGRSFTTHFHVNLVAEVSVAVAVY
jgi:hypothetical protein